jgi:Calx-beta domain
VSFNTQSWGASPIGSDGPYNSLNVGLLTAPATPTVGTDFSSDGVFWNTATAANYTDGGAAGVGVLRFDTNWTPYTPAAELEQLALPTISIGNTMVKEGDSGTVIANVPVSLDHAYPGPVTVHYATATGGSVRLNGRATAGTDYTTASGTLTIPANATSAVIPVSVKGDTRLEQNEHFLVNLSLPTNAVLTPAQSGNVDIGNDELPQVVVKAVTSPVVEGTNAAFKVTLKQTFWTSLTVFAHTVGNTAASPGDYNAVINQPVVFTADTLGPQTVNVLTKTDGLHEAGESFYLQVVGGSAPSMGLEKIKANTT